MRLPVTLQLHGKTATGFEVPAEIATTLDREPAMLRENGR